jgi:ribose transport system ATP-binding protein
MKKEALRFEGVRVEDYRFGGLVDATFCLYQGETLALTGLLRSGKKSLMTILSGRLPDYEGRIYVFSQEVALDSYTTVSKCKIASIGEVPLLFDNMSLSDNICLLNGRKRLFALTNYTIEDHMTKQLLDALQLDISKKSIDQLNGFERTKLEILKVFHGGARIIVFSSTFMYCNEAEASELCMIIKLLNRFGVAVILESDNDFPVYKDVIDRCIVVRSGIVTTTLYKDANGNFDENKIRHVIAGHAFDKIELQKRSLPVEEGRDGFLRIDNRNNGKTVMIGRGSIIGLYDPHDKLPRTVDGLIAMINRECHVYIDGERLVPRYLSDLIDHKIAVITKEFSNDLIFNNLSPVENVCIYANHLFGNKFIYHKRTSEYLYDMVVKKYTVLKHCIGIKDRKHSYDLSYEQQYELMLAKWLALNPEILVIYAPLSNHDMKNAERYREFQVSLGQAGKVLIVISPSYDYLRGFCTKIYEI